MTKPITNFAELQHEKARLQALFALQKNEIKADWIDIKDQLKPVGLVVKGIGMLGKRNSAMGLFNPIINFGVDLIVKKLILRKAGWITRLTVPFLVKNLLSNVAFQKIGNELPALAEWLKGNVEEPEEKEVEKVIEK